MRKETKLPTVRWVSLKAGKYKRSYDRENPSQAINWPKTYLEKGVKSPLKIKPEQMPEIEKASQEYLELVKKHVPLGSHVIEMGCGPGKTAILLTRLGYKVTLVDNDKKMLRTALENIRRNGRIENVKNAVHCDFRWPTNFLINLVAAAVTHQGVLEHFEKEWIQEMLSQQAHHAPVTIFSVPVMGEKSLAYFTEEIPRNLWPAQKWANDILSPFKIREHTLSQGRSNNLLVVLDNAEYLKKAGRTLEVPKTRVWSWSKKPQKMARATNAPFRYSDGSLEYADGRIVFSDGSNCYRNLRTGKVSRKKMESKK